MSADLWIFSILGRDSGGAWFHRWSYLLKCTKCIVYFYISAAKVSANVTKLVKNKRYYVSVRCYKTVGKVTYYSTWSAAKNTVVKK